MMKAFQAVDVRRVSKMTGVSQEEAIKLLALAGGDATQAIRMFVSSRSIAVEPISVEDAPSWRQRAAAQAKRFLEAVPGPRVSVTRRQRALASIPLIVIMLALLALPYAAGGALLIMLLTGCRFRLEGAEQEAGCVAL